MAKLTLEMHGFYAEAFLKGVYVVTADLYSSAKLNLLIDTVLSPTSICAEITKAKSVTDAVEVVKTKHY